MVGVILVVNGEVSPGILVLLNGLEQRLEVSCSEAKVVVTLNDFQKKGWSVLHGFGEDLEQVALVIEVN